MTPHRLTPSTHCHDEIGPNQASAVDATPALLQTTCAAPKWSSVAAASACTDDSSETSVFTVSVSTPFAPICFAAAAKPSSSTSASTTCSPFFAKRSASARPMPLAAPVTTATLPFCNFIRPPFGPANLARYPLSNREEATVSTARPLPRPRVPGPGDRHHLAAPRTRPQDAHARPVPEPRHRGRGGRRQPEGPRPPRHRHPSRRHEVHGQLPRAVRGRAHAPDDQLQREARGRRAEGVALDRPAPQPAAGLDHRGPLPLRDDVDAGRQPHHA